MAAITFAVVASCTAKPGDGFSEGDPLPKGVLARVGRDTVRAESVEKTARVGAISADQALKGIVQDALFGAAARDRLKSSHALPILVSSVLARATLERVRDEARARGLPTERELSEALKRRWPELDRPPSVRTTHAVARVLKPADSSRARKLALRISEAVQGAQDAEEFRRRAGSVDAAGLDVRIESLPPVTEDGRVATLESARKDSPDRFDRRFARAAHALERPGAISPVTETDFGWHVILLEERLPERRLSKQQQRLAVADEIYQRRATRMIQRILSTLRERYPPRVDRGASGLTARVKVER